MKTFYDEIVAGIVTLFKYCMQRDIYEKQTDFQYIYDYSKCCQGNSFYKIQLIQKIFCSEQLHPRLKKTTTSLTTLEKPKSRQVYTNDGIITQNIFNAAVSTSDELKTNTKKLYFCGYLISKRCLLHPGYQI